MSITHVRRSAAKHARSARRAFSLIELVVVMVVVLILASLMMPALHSVQQHAARLFSASNMRQIGMGMSMYSTDNMNNLPASALVWHSDATLMGEMMALYIGEENEDLDLEEQRVRETLVGNRGWEGLGMLYANGYMDTPEVFFCPSHRGDHPVERYVNQFDSPWRMIYSNYHYRGQYDRVANRKITLASHPSNVLVTDGMRTKRDFNHKVGFNSLLGDGSVYWRADKAGRIYSMLPDTPFATQEMQEPGDHDNLYELLWDIVDKM